jgi:hypothetical protein
MPGQLGPTRRDFDWFLRAFATYHLILSNDSRGVTEYTYTDLILLWDTFSDTHNKANLIVNSLDDSISSKGRRDVDDSRVGFHFLDSLDGFLATQLRHLH